jgi:transcription antitermination factor NusG
MLSILARGDDALAEDMPARSGVPWFAVQCGRRPDRERGIIDSLQKLGVDTYWPKIRVIKRVPMRELSYEQRESGVEIMRPRNVPLLPRVVFVNAPSGPSDRLFAVPGIIGLVARSDGMTAIIPGSEIERMRAHEVEGAIPGKTPWHLVFKPGDHVTIVEGALTSLRGIVDRAPDLAVENIDPTTVLRIMVDILGRSTAIDLAAEKLEKLGPGERR